METVMDLNEMKDLFRKMERSLRLVSGLSFRKGMKRVSPDIRFEYDGDSEYYDPEENVIVFGVEGIYNIFQPESKEYALMAYEFVSGHEEQHFRSTATIPYAWGINQGIKAIVAYIYEKETGRRKLFRSDNEAEVVIEELKNKYHIYIDFNTVSKIVSGLQNSLEDGRIERIRSYRNANFRNLRELFRWRNWKRDLCKADKVHVSGNAGAKLTVLFNNILSLATTYKYEKGFYNNFYDDPEMMGYMDKVMPHIQKAVTSPSTRGMAQESVEIVKILAPLIYETAKLPKGFGELLEALRELAKSLIGTPMDASSGTLDKIGGESNLSENDEDTEDGIDSESSEGSDLFSNESDSSSENSKNDAEGKGGGKGSMQENQEGCEHQSGLTDESIDKKKAEEELEKEMAEAAKNLQDQYSGFIDAAESASRSEVTATKKAERSEKPVKSEPIDEKKMSEMIGRRFIEAKRKYPVNLNLPPLVASQGKTLHRQNEKYFKSLSIPDIRYLDKGSIDSSRIYGLACGDYDFYKRTGKPHKNDFCAYVLIDNSGSMHGTKRTNACFGGALIEEGFKGLMPLKIVAFDTTSTINHELVKDWDENFNKNCCYNYLVQGRSGSGNDDQYDIMIATDELMKRPESKKLLCYLSDGAPSSIEATRRSVEAARKKGIQVCGIYFEVGGRHNDNRDFVRIMQKDYICCEPKEIAKNLQLIFKRFSRG